MEWKLTRPSITKERKDKLSEAKPNKDHQSSQGFLKTFTISFDKGSKVGGASTKAQSTLEENRSMKTIRSAKTALILKRSYTPNVVRSKSSNNIPHEGHTLREIPSTHGKIMERNVFYKNYIRY